MKGEANSLWRRHKFQWQFFCAHIFQLFFCFLTEGSVRFERRALPRSPCRQMKMCELAFRIHDSLIPHWGASLVSFQLIKVHTRRCVCAHTCVCVLSCRKIRRSVGTQDTPASRRWTPVVNSSLASGQASGTNIFWATDPPRGSLPFLSPDKTWRACSFVNGLFHTDACHFWNDLLHFFFHQPAHRV